MPTTPTLKTCCTRHEAVTYVSPTCPVCELLSILVGCRGRQMEMLKIINERLERAAEHKESH